MTDISNHFEKSKEELKAEHDSMVQKIKEAYKPVALVTVVAR